MKTILFILCLLIFGTGMTAQRLATHHLGSSAETLTGGQGGLIIHIGEIIQQDLAKIRGGVLQHIDFSNRAGKSYELSDLQLYPNPSQGLIHIKNSDPKVNLVSLIDVDGRLIEQHPIELETKELHLDHLPDATYFLIPSGSDRVAQAISFQIIK